MTLNALPKTDKTLGTHYAKLLPPWPFPDSLTPMDFPLGFSTTQFLLSLSLSVCLSLSLALSLCLSQCHNHSLSCQVRTQRSLAHFYWGLLPLLLSLSQRD